MAPRVPEALLRAYEKMWQEATHHPFLEEVKAGTLAPERFARWLVEDYHFVRHLFKMQARLAAAAPRRDIDLISRGLRALVDELHWFERNARRLKLDLTLPMLPECKAYTDFLHSLSYEPYVAQLVALWALERAYLESWQHASPAASPYEEFARRWTSPEFEEYVQALEQAVLQALEDAAEHERAAAAEAFYWVAYHERRFWDMVYYGT